MKSSTRSRSVGDLGAGLEVHRFLSSSLRRGERYSMVDSGPAVAGEELAVGLQQPGQLQLDDLRQRPLDDPRRLAAAQLRRDRQEELVDQAGAPAAIRAGSGRPRRSPPARLRSAASRAASAGRSRVAAGRFRPRPAACRGRRSARPASSRRRSSPRRSACADRPASRCRSPSRSGRRRRRSSPARRRWWRSSSRRRVGPRALPPRAGRSSSCSSTVVGPGSGRSRRIGRTLPAHPSFTPAGCGQTRTRRQE